MSPTVFREKGYRFFFFSREEPRAHVHIHCSDAVLISADEYEGWRETREIMRNRALMKEIRQGLRQLEKGRRFSFEEVFGEPLRPAKHPK